MSFHYVTNRGKLLAAQGVWDDAGSTAVYMGLIAGSSVPAAMDTEAELQDLNTVADLLALTGVDEPAGGWYSRKNLSRSNVTEDDTDNRAEADAANVTWTAATAGESVIGGFYALEGGTDSQDELLSVFALDAPGIATNGSDLTATIADLYRFA